MGTRSPLDDVHRALGAKMVPFGGWEMPVSYPSGTIEEHLACRRDCVVFDVSHLGTLRVEGAGALERLQSMLTNDLRRIGPGRTQYTHLLDERDGSVLDDIIVWWIDDERFDVMPNASNTANVVDALGGTDTTDDRVVLAVQGPQVRERIGSFWSEAAEVARSTVRRLDWRGATCTVAGTGYTGEVGIEIAVPLTAAHDMWAALVDHGIVPAGLGARDTLRLESGYPLHGHELGPGITPLQAGLGWVVAWGKGDFRGRTALEHEREAGPARHLVAIATEGRRPPRADCAVMQHGATVGSVTSGNFSPILGHGIALALVDRPMASGDAVSIDVRGEALAGSVTTLPFVRGSLGR